MPEEMLSLDGSPYTPGKDADIDMYMVKLERVDALPNSRLSCGTQYSYPR